MDITQIFTNNSPLINNEESSIEVPPASNKEIVIRVNPEYVPEDGVAFDAVQSAIEHFNIPATLVERDVGITPRIVIGLDGGIIQGATSNIPVEYLIYDYDIEGCSDDEVATRPALGGGEVEVFKAGTFGTEVNAGKVAEIFGAVLSENELQSVRDCNLEVRSILVPDAVVKAFRHVQKHHPDVVSVRYGQDLRWIFKNSDGTAPDFSPLVDVGILEDAADSIVSAPVIFTLQGIEASEQARATKMSLSQFLSAAKTSRGQISAHAGILAFEDGSQFDIAENVKALQGLLLDVFMDIREASKTLADFSETPAGDPPHYQETLNKLGVFRKSLEF